jgi:crotonobetainyl-CoA:carnitine CoA-transferase CaiB-like acyl-CoA transferase
MGMAGICDSLNVVEMGSGSAAAAIAGMVLADAGARIIKLEPPAGDKLRRRTPSGFRVWNRGKESLVVDLRTAEGQRDARDLIARADVVIEAFGPGRAKGWNLDPAALCALNPALIHCSITGFGPVGPYADVKGYDSLVAAKAGLWSRGAFGHRDGPIMYPVFWASFGAGLQAVAGILVALRVRDITGHGQQVAATLWAGLEPIDYFVQTLVQVMSKRGEKPTTDSRSSLAATRYGVLAVTKDGRFLQTSTMLPHQGWALSEVAGITGNLDEPRFARLPMFDTPEIAQEWEDLLLEAFREHDLDYWLPKLLASPDVAFEIAVTPEEGLDHPQIVHNGDAITIEDPVVGAIRQVGPLAHFSATPMSPSRSAPEVGKNNGVFPPLQPLTATGAPPAHPFTGVTIVEFGYFYAMPYGVTMAAALGARVVKIEDRAGDPHRHTLGLEIASNKTTAGKESLSIDLRMPEGQEIARRLLKTADVFVTGFRSGVAEKFGLGYEQLREINPGLIYLHAAGYGTDGPYAHRALYAQAAQAVGGSFGRQVGYWSAPERNVDMSVMELQAVVLPRLGQVVDGDSNPALTVLATLALALYHQQRTGQGQFVRTSMIAGNAQAYADDFCAYRGKPSAPVTDDEYWGVSALDRLYPAAEDTFVCIAVYDDAEFTRLAAALDAPQLSEDDRFATAGRRAENDEALTESIESLLLAKPAEEWEQRLTRANVGCAAVNMQGQPMVTTYDPVLLETGLTVAYEHPLFARMIRAAPPASFSETPGRVAPPCLRGEHNRAILRELGYSEDDAVRLEAAGVVIPPDTPTPSATT